MTYTKETLEAKVGELNQYLLNNPNSSDYNQVKQKRNFYVDKLGEMDEYGVEQIVI